MTERIDELEIHYESIERLDIWIQITFYTSALLSLLVPYSDNIAQIWLQQLISILFVITVIAHTILSLTNGQYLIPKVEGKRRKQLLSDALGIPLTPENTQLYYNNEVSPSILRLGLNIMENSFFAKNICGAMLIRERIIISIYALVWIVAILNRSTNLNYILIITQVIFTGDIISRWLNVEIIRQRNERIYDNLYSLYLNRATTVNEHMIAGILDAFASYESAKASASIKQSSKIFNNLNSKLSEEWSKIRGKLGVSN